MANAITKYPADGRRATSRRGGFDRFSVTDESYVPVPWARMLNCKHTSQPGQPCPYFAHDVTIFPQSEFLVNRAPETSVHLHLTRKRGKGKKTYIVAVEMDWVRDGHGRLDDKHDPFVGRVEPHDAAGVGEVAVVVVDLQQAGVVPLDDHRGAVHHPPVEVVAVAAERDGFGQGGAGRGVLDNPRNEVADVLVDAFVRVVVAGGRRVVSGRAG